MRAICKGHDTDWPRPLNNHQVTRFHGRLFDQRIVGYTDWFGERGVLVGHVFRHAMQDLRTGPPHKLVIEPSASAP